jgi:YaiO family outer membrane protein
MSMTNHRLRLALLLLLVLIPALRAEDDAPSSHTTQDSTRQTTVDLPPATGPRLLTNFIEGGGNFFSLSHAFGDWRGGYARGVVKMKKHVLSAEINGQREFGDAGVYIAVGDTYNFNSSWYGSVTVGSSVGGFFWPRFRTDAFINKKWLKRQQWVTTAGYGYYAAKDVHHDQSVFLGTTYYFEKPWILEEGLRLNVSHPGNVFSPSGFVAVTQGRDKRHYVTLRTGFGEEAYQLVGPAVSLNDFTSQTVTVTWRQWVGRSWGFNAVADYYHSPFYSRSGGVLGLFKEF